MCALTWRRPNKTLSCCKPKRRDTVQKQDQRDPLFCFVIFMCFCKKCLHFFWFLFFFHRRVFLLLIFAFVFFHVFFVVFHFSLFIWPKGLGRLFDTATDPLVSA